MTKTAGLDDMIRNDMFFGPGGGCFAGLIQRWGGDMLHVTATAVTLNKPFKDGGI